jgi:hypothetical protein
MWYSLLMTMLEWEQSAQCVFYDYLILSPTEPTQKATPLDARTFQYHRSGTPYTCAFRMFRTAKSAHLSCAFCTTLMILELSQGHSEAALEIGTVLSASTRQATQPRLRTSSKFSLSNELTYQYTQARLTARK